MLGRKILHNVDRVTSSRHRDGHCKGSNTRCILLFQIYRGIACLTMTPPLPNRSIIYNFRILIHCHPGLVFSQQRLNMGESYWNVSISNLFHVLLTNNLHGGLAHTGTYFSNSAVAPSSGCDVRTPFIDIAGPRTSGCGSSAHTFLKWIWKSCVGRRCCLIFYILMVCDEEQEQPNLLITIMARVPPLIITVPVPWNMFVDGLACGGGCICELDWLTCCCSTSWRRVKNLRTKHILVMSTWLLL